MRNKYILSSSDINTVGQGRYLILLNSDFDWLLMLEYKQ